ncbi:MAG TPA: STAS domain-containing protein [Rhizomicrobium sp.]|nr:STAS domain-containing protein [Rhizomicrobium sp.]
MELQHSDVGEVRKVVLAGRLDTAGVDRIETKFGAVIVPAGKNTVVDISEVTFLASMGIRMLIATTRSLSRKGAKLAMFGATPAVKEVIETTALTDIIPLAATENEAIGIVAG